MFTKRHEQELAEIKGLTYEMGKRLQEVLEQLERIKETQDQLAPQDQPGDGERAATTGKRKAGRPKAQAVPRGGTKATGAKKGRGRQPSTPVVGAGAKSGKRRRVTRLGSSGDGPGGGGARKRRRPESAASSGSDEE